MTEGSKKEIWVYGDLRSQRFFDYSLNLLAKARELGGFMSSKVCLVLIGSTGEFDHVDGYYDSVNINEATKKGLEFGADYIIFLDNESLAVPRTDIYSHALARAVDERHPALVMVALTDFGRELAARTARIKGAGLISECMDLRFDEESIVAECPAWGGEITAEIGFAGNDTVGFVTVQPNAFAAKESEGDPGVIERIKIDDLPLPVGMKLVNTCRAAEEGGSLEDADTVLAGGAGLGSAEGFEALYELAALIEGEVGATRPPVFEKWIDESRLIGQTGKTIRPKLLFSIGTSGAIQYTAGITGAGRIVAVNRDRNAAIFKMADIGIEAEAGSFLEIFRSKISQRLMENLAESRREKEKAAKTEIKETIGMQIRKIRESRQWSSEKFAEFIGQTPEFIEKLESDEATPPVSFLTRLADLLKVDPGKFLKKEEKARILDLRSQAFKKRAKEESYQALSVQDKGSENDRLRAYILTIEPHKEHKTVAYKHEGEEFIFVMEGDLLFTLGGNETKMSTNESMHFNSDIPHKLKSISDIPTKCLIVIYLP